MQCLTDHQLQHKSSSSMLDWLQGHLAPVLDVAWSFDGSFLASCDCDGVVLIWRRARSRLD